MNRLLPPYIIKQTEEVCEDYNITTLAMACGSEKRTLRHIHYTTWPDHGLQQRVPIACDSF